MEHDVAPDADDKPMVASTPLSTLRPDPNVLAKRVGDEIVLVHLETNRIYELNRTAALLWDALTSGSTRAELEEQLALEFEVERDELTNEIDEMLSQFTSEQLIHTE